MCPSYKEHKKLYFFANLKLSLRTTTRMAYSTMANSLNKKQDTLTKFAPIYVLGLNIFTNDQWKNELLCLQKKALKKRFLF